MGKNEYTSKIMDIISENVVGIDEGEVTRWKDRLLRWFSKGDNETYAWIVAEVGIINGFVIDRLEKIRGCDIEDGAHIGSAMADIVVSNKLNDLFDESAEAAFHAMLGTEDDDEVTNEQKAGLFAAIAELLGGCKDDEED
jgi:hypothetical protein